MRKVLAVLAATGSLAIGMAATATTAQADWYGYDWNDWHFGGDYYAPTAYGYGYLYNYAPPVAAVSTVGMVAPVQTVQTVTVRTIRPSRFAARRRVVTRTMRARRRQQALPSRPTAMWPITAAATRARCTTMRVRRRPLPLRSCKASAMVGRSMTMRARPRSYRPSPCRSPRRTIVTPICGIALW